MQNISNILEVLNIKKSYNNFLALNNVSLKFKPGEFITLLGPNGAGKSTLFSILSGMLSPDEGDCIINGNSIKYEPVMALKSLGIVFQQSTIDNELTVLENLIFHARLHGLRVRNITKKIDSDLKESKLETKIFHKIKTLSGGEKRKVELIRALMHTPKVLLMDEPTVGLDPRSRKELINKILKLKKSNQVSILWATHLVDEAESSDRVIILNKGKVVKTGSPKNLIKITSSDTLAQAFLKLTKGKNEKI